MNLDRYEAYSDSKRRTYEFLSSGPKGTIKKVVIFDEIQSDVYNLAFGDWDEELQELRDDTRSNNNDRDKVLATVAHSVLDFMKHHPEATVYAEGITKTKTRLYQMGINAHWAEINQLYDIEGLTNGKWAPFKHNVNYDAFILVTKKS